MRGFVLGLAAAALLVASLATFAAEGDPPPVEPPHRPRIGLALGGGGARGGAHIGVLKELERRHIPVDFVAGTSMGAIIGGLYASGVPVAKIESVLEELNWSDIIADRASYRDLVWRRKEDEGRYLLDIELGLRRGKIVVPTGLRGGQKLGYELQALLLPVGGVTDFSNLPVPFRAVATDLGTGEAVVLDHGDLANSILASMTIPGIFAPVEIDGRLLVDGGMSDNLPVEVVREMGADIVIAVDVGTPLASPKAIRSYLGVTSQAFNFLTRLNSVRSSTLADLVIRPDLEGIGSADFKKVPDAIGLGEAAANAVEDKLAPLAVDDAAWKSWSDQRAPLAQPQGPLTFVRVEGNQRVPEKVVLARARIRPGDPVDPDKLRGAVQRVFGLDDFQWVRFHVEQKDGETGLVLNVREKPWGPTYLHFGIDASDDFKGGATFGVKMNLTRANVNARGGEWRNDFQIGTHPAVKTELFQPLDAGGRLFVAPWLEYVRGQQPLFVDNQKIAAYEVDEADAHFDGGIEYGRFGELRLGVYRSRIHAKVDTGAADLPRFDVDGGGISFAAVFDTRDRPAIPRHGSALSLRATFSRDGLGATESYDRVEAGAAHFFGRGRHTAYFALAGGTSLGSQIPVYDEFVVGGLFSLGGYSEGEIRGQYSLGGSVGYHFRLLSLPSGFGEGVYVGVELDGANAWPTSQAISISDLLYGVTAILGADTIAGPLFLAYGHGQGGHDRIYLTLGRSF